MSFEDVPRTFKRRKVHNVEQPNSTPKVVNENGLSREQAMKIGLPQRWKYCPKYGRVINDLFFPMKTPLSEGYDDLLETQYRFHVDDVFKIEHPNGLKIKLWINLANTERFYGINQVRSHGCEYMHMPLTGHGGAPTKKEVDRFLRVVNGYKLKGEPGLIAIHCTHGFNRTGFLIAAALVEFDCCDPSIALQEFAEARPHGIYKEDYLQEFFSRFDSFYSPDEPLPIEPPGRPGWENGPDHDLEYEAFMGPSSSNNQSNNYPLFMDGKVPNCNYVTDTEQRQYLQEKVCKYIQPFTKKTLKPNMFSGSQPVSMDHDNLTLLAKSKFWVSWKADGMRYLVLINGAGEVYAFDRDNNVFELPLTFPRENNVDEHIEDTLIDCEVIMDKQIDGSYTPRMLIYDIIILEKDEVGKKKYGRRLQIIEDKLIKPRIRAFETGKLKPDMSVRLKNFYFLDQTYKVLRMDNQLGHHTDGLIFQPEDDPYTPDRFDRLLKWKPAEESSIDFKLHIEKHEGDGMLREYRANLHVLGLNEPFAYMKATKTLQKYNGKIIECNFYDNSFHFMRERTDKSHPNALSTAQSVMKTIKNPLTEKQLLDFIHYYGFKEGKGIRLPPTQHHQQHLINGNIQHRDQVL